MKKMVQPKVNKV